MGMTALHRLKPLEKTGPRGQLGGSHARNKVHVPKLESVGFVKKMVVHGQTRDKKALMGPEKHQR